MFSKTVNHRAQVEILEDKTNMPGRYAMLEVRDTGEDIPGEIMAKIFYPYLTTKRQGQGYRTGTE
ncbi:hypothetical protein GF1_30090 [Desulfolithobacter dissulfuricans]|uniref:Histidine kinase/HSP90-like ATPase domain-containing protein n=1 Tax=Desulfolithobacter dissulfuricans TaxID=2795293 RepID=A0A915XLE5_9BACT|nr:hypothetical protein GF1_30090 [Desulfolithobacter dissulfuricans]